jgi:calcium-dependent protein kinase
MFQVLINRFNLQHFTFGEVQHEAVGTPYTVAPEVIKGSYDERCDGKIVIIVHFRMVEIVSDVVQYILSIVIVWAVGVITYLLLSGEPPFGGCGGPETLLQVRDNILRGTFRFEPEDVWETVSIEAKDFIRSLLVLDPMQRPTAKQAKGSKWLKMWRHVENGDEAPEINPNVVKALIGFKEYSDMRKLLCEVLSFTLLPEQIQGLRNEFEKYDQDGYVLEDFWCNKSFISFTLISYLTLFFD